MSDRRCGTCRHWEPLLSTKPIGACKADLFLVPSLKDFAIRDTDPKDGDDCPLWQPKESKQ